MVKPRAYYNEFDPKSAAWLRELIAAGEIMDGEVDERDIRDVRPEELNGFVRCHFFAGIGGWDLALQLAGWPEERPVWTGSAPCQPFSAAGKRGGVADERHLWPFWHWIIDQCQPEAIFGEQVASKDGLGWLDLVCADLEGTGYAVRAEDRCAAGSGAPHIRQRLWFGAERLDHAAGARHVGPVGGAEGDPRDQARLRLSGAGRATGGLADADGRQSRHGDLQPGGQHGLQPQGGGTGGLADASGIGRQRWRTGEAGDGPGTVERPDGLCDAGGLADRDDAGLEGCDREHAHAQGRQDAARHSGPLRPSCSEPFASALDGFWRDADWLLCRDGKWRPTKSTIFPLAHGVPGRVGLLRGAGNAIVPQVAAQFIQDWQADASV